ncbi:hypothetical protein [Mucilaginibacter ginsenosidivorax]|uniref:DUF1795 domain-containing protein n=1 Tax=Mucilaginibacter ginsenosidivorax TaxID=862126 RepID=A0A5B8VWN5_9SPHI|nr:hypothetical protein [Mucilaginibacter ginsenosidivorax]QEC75035.1 hypothetical protein FSB76_03375 [Mucilaginibacter ginsenosidivorax]
MKLINLYLIFSLVILSNAVGQTKRSTAHEYRNDIYKFAVKIPGDWKLYGQIQNDTSQHRAIADWGLPLTHSELENADIENSISITAYKRTGINSLAQLIEVDKKRTNPATTSFETNGTNDNSLIISTSTNGLKYKGKSYYIFKNGIGYVVNFMATPGTYDKNIAMFERFYKNIKYE